MQKNVPPANITAQIKISHRQVERVYETYRSIGRVNRKGGSGRPKVLTKALKNQIITLEKKNPFMTCDQIAERLNDV